MTHIIKLSIVTVVHAGSKMASIPFLLLFAFLLGSNSLVAAIEARDKGDKPRNSIRHRTERVDDEDSVSPWWTDSNLLNPVERIEIEDQAHSKYKRSSVGPFLGPIVDVGDGNISVVKEEIAPQRTSRIVQGQEAEPHSFFAMLLVKEGPNWRWSGCGGTLVSDCHIVTAGHCVIDPLLPVVGVFINAYSPFAGNNSDVPFHFSQVQKIEIHPNFDLPTNEADIAIIHMTECLDVQQFPPALIAEDTSIYTQQYRPREGNQQPRSLIMQVLGFGSMLDAENVPADILRQVRLPYLSRRDCLEFYGADEVLRDMVCAGYVDTGGPDACQGDSGGGLIHYTPTSTTNSNIDNAQLVPHLVGIVSWGVGCGRKDYPGVYILTLYYRSWIMERICAPSSASVPVGDMDYRDQPWCHGITAFGVQPGGEGRVVALSFTDATQQAEQHLNYPQCGQEGDSCFVGSDCCSSFCRGFPGEIVRRCTGVLPGVQEEQRSSFRPLKTGGAGGAKEQEAGP